MRVVADCANGPPRSDPPCSDVSGRRHAIFATDGRNINDGCGAYPRSWPPRSCGSAPTRRLARRGRTARCSPMPTGRPRTATRCSRPQHRAGEGSLPDTAADRDVELRLPAMPDHGIDVTPRRWGPLRPGGHGRAGGVLGGNRPGSVIFRVRDDWRGLGPRCGSCLFATASGRSVGASPRDGRYPQRFTSR